MAKLLTLLHKKIPADHSRQVPAHHFMDILRKNNQRILKILDLGCGTGQSWEYFHHELPEASWTGLDIKEFDAWKPIERSAAEFHTYDGTRMPFDGNFFDLVYCRQVMEHVRHPEKVMIEVNRILKPGGYFVGSTSHLEPYHSQSLWNYTPYGLSLLMEDAGFIVLELRPGVDAATLIARRVFRESAFFARWFEKESPGNIIIGLIGRLTRKGHIWTNAVKLLFCGQFHFIAQKPR